MGHPRKYYTNKSVHFVTLSLEQGLLLLANPLSQQIIKSCLARAQFLYPVRISHFLVHSNHIHIVFVVINPADAAAFLGYFKAEVAHRMNEIFGWNKRTVWCEGNDTPVILTPKRALIAVAYLYANAAKDLQEDTIDLYPGLNSWKMYQTGNHSSQWKFIRRPAYKPLPKDAHTLEGYTREAERLGNQTKKAHTFFIEPNAWLKAFDITDPEAQKLWNEALVKRVRKLEARAREKRGRENKHVIGRERLKRQAMTLDYRSKRSGKRMWCLSEKRSVRVQFISFFKHLLEEAAEVYKRWHVGDYSVPYPPGLFPPPQPKLMELLRDW